MKQIFFYTPRRWLTIFSRDAFMGTEDKKILLCPWSLKKRVQRSKKSSLYPLEFEKKGTEVEKVFPVPLEFEKKGTAVERVFPVPFGV